MTAPEIENIASKQQEQQGLPWNNLASVNPVGRKEKDAFTKIWTRRNNKFPLGPNPSISTSPLLNSSLFWQGDTDDLGITPSISEAALLSFGEKDYQGKRNIVLTGVPMASYMAINGFINCFRNIKDILTKCNSGGVTLVIVFYDVQEALNCYTSLDQLLHEQPDLSQVRLQLVNNYMVASYLDNSLDTLQDAHLSISMYGPMSHLVEFDYLKLLEAVEPVHYVKELKFTEAQRSFVVEYSDTRTATATQKLIHGNVYKDIIIKACLFKPGNVPGRLLSPIDFKNHGSCEYSGIIRHSSRPFDYQNDLGNINRNMKDEVFSHQALGIPPTLSLHNLHPSISASPTSSISLSPTTPTQNHHPFSGHSFSQYDSNSTATTNKFAKHQPQNQEMMAQQLPPPPLQQERQQQLDIQSVEVPQGLSAHLLGSLTQELSSASLDYTGTSRSQHNEYLCMLNDFNANNVIHGYDRRTTFMIRNIPNKYDQAMLKEWIDVTHKETYDFLYLRMDFWNRCSVGYAFINFIEVESVISFAHLRGGKPWNYFNSQKICQLSYANIQGKQRLIKKFQNSDVMKREEAFRPKIFYSSGIDQGEEEPFPAPTRSRNHKI